MRCAILLLACLSPALAQELRTEAFDADPGWDGHNNRPSEETLREVVQDFGYAPEQQPPAVGGLITPDGNPAYYAKEIAAATLDTPLHASGTVRVEKGAGHILLGFFNHATINEWRTPNSIALRINGRGDTFHVHVEYCTAKWRAGAGIIGRYDAETDRNHPLELPADMEYPWTLTYDPAGNEGAGKVTATFGGVEASCNLSASVREDGASFDRFGLLNIVKSVDSPGTFWLRDLEVMGEGVDLATDPQWDALRNREKFLSAEVRPRFDFGWSETNHAGGKAPGEIGGLLFRGDCRYPDKLAYYGAETGPLDLDRPLHASGRVVLMKGVSDSTTFFGFFHHEHSVWVNESQKAQLPMNFLGWAIEGPSAEGFYFYPVWRAHGEAESTRVLDYGPPRIYPDSATHEWSLDYAPKEDGGEISLSMDGKSVTIPVTAEARKEGAVFDRLGFVTAWIDGNGQRVYVDDLRFGGDHSVSALKKP